MPIEIIDRAKLPDTDKEMVLVQNGDHVCIKVGKRPLMSSDVHDSEDMFGSIAAQAIEEVKKPRVLIGGLGLGFTLRAALDRLPKTAHVDVAELVPEVVKWNKAKLGVYAKRPLRDKRVKLIIDDVANVIAAGKARYDLIALDVDNGPAAMTQHANENLYRRVGLAKIKAALKSGGVLAVWSAFPSRTFTKSLEVVGKVQLVRTHPSFDGGPRYYIWLATKPAAR